MADLTETILAFLGGIAIPVTECDVPAGFLPGLDIGAGAVRLDRDRLAYPGDILHEAGHLAVTAEAGRGAERLDPTPGDEMAAIAWSYAAARHLGIASALLFHDHGYKGGARAIREAFDNGCYFGVPLLAWYGMTCDPARADAGYPHMLRWLR